MKKYFSPYSFSVLVGVVAVAFLTAWYAFAFDPPAATPPGCPPGTAGCDAPVNVGGTLQHKQGTLQVDNFRSFLDGIFTGNVDANQLCIAGDCKSSWVAVSGSPHGQKLFDSGNCPGSCTWTVPPGVTAVWVTAVGGGGGGGGGSGSASFTPGGNGIKGEDSLFGTLTAAGGGGGGGAPGGGGPGGGAGSAGGLGLLSSPGSPGGQRQCGSNGPGGRGGVGGSTIFGGYVSVPQFLQTCTGDFVGDAFEINRAYGFGVGGNGGRGGTGTSAANFADNGGGGGGGGEVILKSEVVVTGPSVSVTVGSGGAGGPGGPGFDPGDPGVAGNAGFVLVEW